LFRSSCEPAAEESLDIDELPHEQKEKEEEAAEAATEDLHGAAVSLKRSSQNIPGDSADAPALKKSKIEGRKVCTLVVKLAPLLYAYPGGRVLTPTRALDTAINSLSVPKEIGSACLTSFVDGPVHKDVRVVVKVPQGIAEGMAGISRAKVQMPYATGPAARDEEGASAAGIATASAAAHGVAANTAGPRAAGPIPAASDEVAATAGAAAGALLCPGCDMVAVHDFNALLRNRPQDGQLRLARLTSDIRPFVTWRLFALEAVGYWVGVPDGGATSVWFPDHG
jgi:hypothetical protein